MIQHVENLRMTYTKEHAELLELREALMQSERSFGSQTEKGDERFHTDVIVGCYLSHVRLLLFYFFSTQMIFEARNRCKPRSVCVTSPQLLRVFQFITCGAEGWSCFQTSRRASQPVVRASGGSMQFDMVRINTHQTFHVLLRECLLSIHMKMFSSFRTSLL